MAIRKARLDFGIEVTLDRTDPVPAISSEARYSQENSSGRGSSQMGQQEVVQTRSAVPEAVANRSTDPGTPSAQARLHPHFAELPFVLSARISTTDPASVKGTLTRQQPPPTVEGLSSFGEFPSNSIHCVHGTIRYPEDPHPEQFGHILYIKASLTGDEPPDLLNYRRQHEKFPHDTTLNQFFTESQFESYRRLGEHILLSDETIISWLNRYVGRREDVSPPGI